jgi:hypothetical protein
MASAGSCIRVERKQARSEQLLFHGNCRYLLLTGMVPERGTRRNRPLPHGYWFLKYGNGPEWCPIHRSEWSDTLVPNCPAWDCEAKYRRMAREATCIRTSHVELASRGGKARGLFRALRNRSGLKVPDSGQFRAMTTILSISANSRNGGEPERRKVRHLNDCPVSVNRGQAPEYPIFEDKSAADSLVGTAGL